MCDGGEEMRRRRSPTSPASHGIEVETVGFLPLLPVVRFLNTQKTEGSTQGSITLVWRRRVFHQAGIKRTELKPAAICRTVTCSLIKHGRVAQLMRPLVD